jgi:hypothetical protein
MVHVSEIGPMMPIVAAKPISKYLLFIGLFFWKQRRTYGKILDGQR